MEKLKLFDFNSEKVGNEIYNLFENHSLKDLENAIKNMPRSSWLFPFPYLTLISLILQLILWFYGRIAQEDIIKKYKLRNYKEIAEKFPDVST